MESQKKKYLLKNWTIIRRVDFTHAYFAITGWVYDHPYYPEGSYITSSEIVRIEDDYIETKNSIYLLDRPGEVMPENNLVDKMNNKIKELNKTMTELQLLIEDVLAENRVLQMYKNEYLKKHPKN